jgi:hypothetical protein
MISFAQDVAGLVMQDYSYRYFVHRLSMSHEITATTWIDAAAWQHVSTE